MNVSVQNLGEIPEMFLPCEIPQLDIQDMGRNHIVHFFLVPVYKIISVQETYSDSLFVSSLRVE